MAVLQMQRVSICALKKDRKSILEKLQSMGILEISQVADEDDAFSRMDTMNARVSFEKKANIADQALDVLDGYAPESKSMFASLEGKKLIGSSRFQSAVADKEKIMDTAADLIQTSKVIAEKKAAILKLENQIESLTPYLSLEVPMNYSGTKKVAMFIGTMAAETQLQDVYSTLAEQLPEVEAVDIQIISSDQDAVYLAVLCMRKDASKVEEVLRSAGFARPAQLSEEVPSVKTQELKESIQQLNNEIKEQEDKIKSCAEERERLRYISDYFRMRAEKYEVLGTLPQSQRTFVISGYTAKKFVPALEKAIGANYDCVMDVEEVGEEEEVPTILQNNSFSRSWEGIVESYGLPKRGEFDPTTIMSFFYVFFFGMMLSDAAYGAILAIACFVLLKKFPRMSPGMYQSIKLFMFCGISTVIWGILFGGYFGNIVDVVSAKFFGTTITPAALWFIPLNDPMKLLVYSMLFGVIHLFVGLGIKGYMCIKNRQFMDFFCDVVLWFCLVVGLILMLLPSSLFASIAHG